MTGGRARVGDLDLCSIDGILSDVPTPRNRETFGSAGTAYYSSPYPQLRELRLSHASTLRHPGAGDRPVRRPRPAAAGTRAKPSRCSWTRHRGSARPVDPGPDLGDGPELPRRPAHQRLLATGTHVLIRVKDGITLTRAGGFLPDGSYLAIRGGGVTLTVRVIEYTITVAGADVPQPDPR